MQTNNPFVVYVIPVTIFFAGMLKLAFGWLPVFYLFGILGLSGMIAVSWSRTVLPTLSGIFELIKAVLASGEIFKRREHVMGIAFSGSILIGVYGVTRQGPPLYLQSLTYFAFSHPYLILAILIIMYAIFCAVVLRFKFHTELRSSEGNFGNVFAIGATRQLILICVATLLSIALYESADRRLHNSIIGNAQNLEKLLYHNAESNLRHRLSEIINEVRPLIADQPEVALILETLNDRNGNQNQLAIDPEVVNAWILDKGFSDRDKSVPGSSTKLNQLVTKWREAENQPIAVALSDDWPLFFDANNKLHDEVRELLHRPQDGQQFLGHDLLAAILGNGDQDEWGYDYSKTLPRANSEQRAIDLSIICQTEYQYPKSFELSARIGKKIATTNPEEKRRRLMLVAALLADPIAGEFKRDLWKNASSNKTVEQQLGSGAFQDLLQRNVLTKIESFRFQFDESGQLIEATRQPYLLGLTVPAIRGLIRGPIQLFTLILCVWGILYLIIFRVPVCLYQYGYMPIGKVQSTSTTGTYRWRDFWGLQKINANDTSRNSIIPKIYAATNHSSDLIPRLVNAVLTAKKEGHTDSEVENAGRSAIQEWRRDAEKENRLLELLIFALPNVGFLGTIIGLTRGLGIAYSIGVPSDDPFHKSAIIASMSTQLGTAFYTTLVALLCLLPLAFFTFWLQRLQDSIAKRSEQCLEHLLERLT